jgi:transcriptional regulator with XRE-family HTH domain
MRERTFLLDREKTKEIREERGLQAELARKMDVSRHRLNLWLMGVNSIPETYLNKLCVFTNKQPSDLLSEESKKFLSNLLILA